MPSDNRAEWSKELAWFLTGAVMGATVALLFAPKSGRDTRKLISKTGRAGKEAVSETTKEFVDTGRDLYDRGCELVEHAADLFERGRKLVEE